MKKHNVVLLASFILVISASCEKEKVTGKNGTADQQTFHTDATPKMVYFDEKNCLEKDETIKDLRPEATLELQGGEILFISMIKKYYGSLLFVATNKSGEVLWTRWIEQTGGDINLKIKGYAAMPDGGFVICASGAKKYATLNRLMKFDNKGNIEWEQELGRVSWESGSHRQGGPVLVRGSDILSIGKDLFKPWSGTADYHDVVVYRLNFDGTGIEGKSILSSDEDPDNEYNVLNAQVKGNGDIQIVGYSYHAYFVLELTEDLSFKSMNTYDLKNEKISYKTASFLSDGSILIGGYTSMNATIESSTNPDRFIFIHADSKGDPIWAKAYSAPGYLANVIFDKYSTPDLPIYFAELPDKSILVQTACLSTNDPYGHKIGHVFAIDINGSVKWGRSLSSDSASFFGPGYANTNGQHLLFASNVNVDVEDENFNMLIIPALSEGFSYPGSKEANLLKVADHEFTKGSYTAKVEEWNKFEPTTRKITRDCELKVVEVEVEE